MRALPLPLAWVWRHGGQRRMPHGPPRLLPPPPPRPARSLGDTPLHLCRLCGAHRVQRHLHCAGAGRVRGWGASGPTHGGGRGERRMARRSAQRSAAERARRAGGRCRTCDPYLPGIVAVGAPAVAARRGGLRGAPHAAGCGRNVFEKGARDLAGGPAKARGRRRAVKERKSDAPGGRGAQGARRAGHPVPGWVCDAPPRFLRDPGPRARRSLARYGLGHRKRPHIAARPPPRAARAAPAMAAAAGAGGAAVSPLPLEAYVALLDALTGDAPRGAVRTVSPIEAPYFKVGRHAGGRAQGGRGPGGPPPRLPPGCVRPCPPAHCGRRRCPAAPGRRPAADPRAARPRAGRGQAGARRRAARHGRRAPGGPLRRRRGRRGQQGAAGAAIGGRPAGAGLGGRPRRRAPGCAGRGAGAGAAAPRARASRRQRRGLCRRCRGPGRRPCTASSSTSPAHVGRAGRAGRCTGRRRASCGSGGFRRAAAAAAGAGRPARAAAAARPATGKPCAGRARGRAPTARRWAGRNQQRWRRHSDGQQRRPAAGCRAGRGPRGDPWHSASSSPGASAVTAPGAAAAGVPPHRVAAPAAGGIRGRPRLPLGGGRAPGGGGRGRARGTARRVCAGRRDGGRDGAGRRAAAAAGAVPGARAGAGACRHAGQAICSPRPCCTLR
jgi:hypothetical protein